MSGSFLDVGIAGEAGKSLVKYRIPPEDEATHLDKREERRDRLEGFVCGHIMKDVQTTGRAGSICCVSDATR